MPRYVTTVSGWINQIGNAFQSFNPPQSSGRGGYANNDFDAFTPKYGMNNIGQFGSANTKRKTYKKKTTKRKKSTKRKRN